MQLQFRDTETRMLPPRNVEVVTQEEITAALKERERTYSIAILTADDQVKQSWVRSLGSTVWRPQRMN